VSLIGAKWWVFRVFINFERLRGTRGTRESYEDPGQARRILLDYTNHTNPTGPPYSSRHYFVLRVVEEQMGDAQVNV